MAPITTRRHRVRRSVVVAGTLTALLLAGCGDTPQEASDRAPDSAMPDQLAMCPEERPEVCTQHYDPACGYFDGSEQSGPSRQTFGNACTACSDNAVVGYTAGPCE